VSRAPIQGPTIGGGALSIKVAKEYIQMTALIHLSFKPASMDAIQQVINGAKANPTFPVILQRIGGGTRCGHSFEDFNQPILQMCRHIRA